MPGPWRPITSADTDPPGTHHDFFSLFSGVAPPGVANTLPGFSAAALAIARRQSQGQGSVLLPSRRMSPPSNSVQMPFVQHPTVSPVMTTRASQQQGAMRQGAESPVANDGLSLLMPSLLPPKPKV